MIEKKIGEIKMELQAAAEQELPLFIQSYEADERTGVQALVLKAKKRLEALEKEILRTEEMKRYEKQGRENRRDIL